MNSYLSHMLDCFPDRLAEAKWQGCCRFVGLERLQEAKQNGRPVVLAFAHFGPYWLLLTWLRCAGFPVASLASGKAADHSRIRAWQARYLPFPEIPASFYQDELRETAGFLAAGHPLGLSVDNAHASGKQMEVPFCEGWNFRMATGLVRMAIRQKAVVIPCLMIDEGGWHYRIELGRPVPEEFLTTEAEWSQAGKYVLDEMMPHLLMQPELCKRDFVLCLQKNTDGNSGAVA